MMEMVNDSRRTIAVMSLGIMRRSFLESAIFSWHRRAFGRALRDLPMMREMLVGMTVELEAAAALVFASASGNSALARLLVPVAKLRASRRGVEFASQAVEVHGGNGYVENWPVARQLRDAQSNTIWEGTENIICLDILRALRSEQVMQAAFTALGERVEAAGALLAATRATVARALGEVREALAHLSRLDREVAELRARVFGNYLADAASAALLLEEAAFELSTSGGARKAVIAHLFAEVHLGRHSMRGLLSEDRGILDLFDPIVCYGEIEQTRAAVALRAG